MIRWLPWVSCPAREEPPQNAPISVSADPWVPADPAGEPADPPLRAPVDVLAAGFGAAKLLGVPVDDVGVGHEVPDFPL